MKNYKLKVFVLFFLQVIISKLYSSELMTSADRNTDSKIDFSVYWLQEKRDITVNAISAEKSVIFNLDTTVSTFSSTAKSREQYELKEKNYLPSTKITIHLNGKFHPYIKFGISKTELTGYGKKWESNRDGIVAGFGLKYVLLQDTIVTPAFAVDTGITFRTAKIKKLDDVSIDLNYKTTEIATSFWTSKKLRRFEPYFGLQMSFVNGEFENCDIDADSINIFYGCLYKILSGVNLAFENSFINVKNFNFSAGVKVRI